MVLAGRLGHSKEDIDVVLQTKNKDISLQGACGLTEGTEEPQIGATPNPSTSLIHSLVIPAAKDSNQLLFSFSALPELRFLR